MIPDPNQLLENCNHFEIIETFRTNFLDKLLERWDLEKTLDQQEEPVISLLYNIFYPNA